MACNNDYEMIFMDLQMPIMDGFEATTLIREFNKEVPIIAMSANVFADAKQRAREAGVTDFWWKYGCAAVVGIDTFGESAPANVLFRHFGFTPENVAETVRAVLAQQ